MGYSEAIKALRVAYKLTQSEFAELLQVSKPTIQKLEAGDYPPSEKMAARLTELFRSKRFREEFRLRAEVGDLRAVREAFGELLDAADGEGGEGFFESGRTINIVDAYMDLKSNYAEFRAVVRSQQDTIRDLSVSTRNHSEAIKNHSEATKNYSESTKNISATSKTIAESNRNLSVSIKNLSAGRAVGKRQRIS